MPNTDVELYCSSALRYERWRSGLRKLRRSATRRKAPLALRFAPL